MCFWMCGFGVVRRPWLGRAWAGQRPGHRRVEPFAFVRSTLGQHGHLAVALPTLFFTGLRHTAQNRGPVFRIH